MAIGNDEEDALGEDESVGRRGGRASTRSSFNFGGTFSNRAGTSVSIDTLNTHVRACKCITYICVAWFM